MADAVLVSAAALLVSIGVSARADDDPVPTDEPEVWTLLSPDQWLDEFSPLYSDGEEGYCVGDPSTPDDPPGGPPPLVDLQWLDPTTNEIHATKYLANSATMEFLPGVPASSIRATMATLGLRIRNAWFDPTAEVPMSWFYVDVLPSSSYHDDVPGLLAFLRAQPMIKSANYDEAWRSQSLPPVIPTGSATDPDYPKQTEYPHLHADAAWDVERLIPSANVVGVVVLDSGIWTEQPDLKRKIYKKPGTNKRWGMKYLNGKIKFKSIEKQRKMREPQHTFAGSWHATAVASVCAAEANNGAGICGFAPGPQVTVMSAEIPMVADDSYNSAPIPAMLQLLTKKAAGGAFANLRVVNMSFGSKIDDSGFHGAINADRSASGRLYIAAAGNSFDWQNPYKDTPNYPAAWPEVLGVTGVDPNGTTDDDVWSHYSVFSSVYLPGGGGTTLDLSVYGVSAYFTCRVDAWRVLADGTFSEAYGTAQGTSFAAPQISALAALLFAQDSMHRTAAWVDGHIKRVKKHGDYYQISFGDSYYYRPATFLYLPGVADFSRALQDQNP